MHGFITKPHNDLLDILTRFREKDAAGPRDRIYALLGLASQGYGIGIDPEKSLKTIYQEITLSLINVSANLDIILQNPFEKIRGPDALENQQDTPDRASNSPRETLPSWAAHFGTSRYVSIPILFAQRDIFSAGTKKIHGLCHVASRNRDIPALHGAFSIGLV